MFFCSGPKLLLLRLPIDRSGYSKNSVKVSLLNRGVSCWICCALAWRCYSCTLRELSMVAFDAHKTKEGETSGLRRSCSDSVVSDICFYFCSSRLWMDFFSTLELGCWSCVGLSSYGISKLFCLWIRTLMLDDFLRIRLLSSWERSRSRNRLWLISLESFAISGVGVAFSAPLNFLSSISYSSFSINALKFSFCAKCRTFCQSDFDIYLTSSSSWLWSYSTVDATDGIADITSDWDYSARNSSNSSSSEAYWLSILGHFFAYFCNTSTDGCTGLTSFITTKSWLICLHALHILDPSWVYIFSPQFWHFPLIKSLILSPLNWLIDVPF